MTDKKGAPEPKPNKRPVDGKASDGKDSLNAGQATDDSSKKLTPEEQMALYEKDLKENDWGHQPC